MANNIKVSPYGKVKVEWADKPENYSKEAKTRIKNHFATKYGLNKNSINVVYKPVKINAKGETVEINGKIENIMDASYQRMLMKAVLERDEKVVDFDKILALDDKINSQLNVDLNQSQHKSWSLRWVRMDNFLSFGDNNFLSFSKLKGLTIVNSTPENASGKTTLSIDVMKFLLYGSTTKTDKNEEIFNRFTDKNEMCVRGMIEIEGEETIIERKLSRSKKKDGSWSVSNKVSYYTILPDGSEENQNEEEATKTTKKIKETIGSEKDFEMLVLATERNLDDLIGLTTTESGKILTRLIGLEVLELKEKAVREMYNEFSRKKKSNEYDVITLTTQIKEHQEKIVLCDELNKELTHKLSQNKEKIVELNGENDRLINSKDKIETTILTLNPSKLNEEITTLTAKGVALKGKHSETVKTILEMGEISFDEDLHHSLTKELAKLSLDKGIAESEIKKLKSVVKELVEGGICKSCNRKLDDVDNSEHIAKHNETIMALEEECGRIGVEISSNQGNLSDLNKIKQQIDIKHKLELDRDRVDVEIGGLRNTVVSKMNDLKKYNLNIESIEKNKKIDSEISRVKTDLVVFERSKDTCIANIERVNSDSKNHSKDILEKEKLIEIIKQEEEVDRVYRIYIDLVGKKGISKLVLRSVLPIINSELQRLLEDVTEFEIEIFMDEKNDVQFLLNMGETTKQLKSASGFEKTASSLALRAILGKMSTLPMPNFITFDEILGRVALENLEKMRVLFDKIKEMYEVVFLITFNPIIRDWADNIITVNKVNHISSITIK